MLELTSDMDFALHFSRSSLYLKHQDIFILSLAHPWVFLYATEGLWKDIAQINPDRMMWINSNFVSGNCNRCYKLLFLIDLGGVWRGVGEDGSEDVNESRGLSSE